MLILLQRGGQISTYHGHHVLIRRVPDVLHLIESQTRRANLLRLDVSNLLHQLVRACQSPSQTRTKDRQLTCVQSGSAKASMSS